MLITTDYSFSQEPEKRIPDGTQGEFFELSDSAISKSKYAKWNYFDGPLTTLKLGGGFLYKVAGYSKVEASKEQLDLKTTFKVRDTRVTLSGKFKSQRELTWKAGVMYNLVIDGWLIRESGVVDKLFYQKNTK